MTTPSVRTHSRAWKRRCDGSRAGQHPVIDRAMRFRGVVYTFGHGHGHQGLIGGAVTGKLISEMAADMPTSVDQSLSVSDPRNDLT